ncbi:MAG: response regulator [bacterium]|jgi:CheY-like chemotaxis protein|nr:MAG: response regulator [bacterium]
MSARRLILIVEDDRFLRQAFRILLEDAGYRVREAGTGSEALEAAEEGPAAVVLDLGLPDQPGLDVCRALRAHPATRDAVIVALTGRAGAAERRACLEAGCTLYFAKPIEPRELLRQLAGLLP